MKKFRNWILMALVLCMVLSCVIGPASAIEDETRADLFDRHGFEYIPYNYTPGGIADKSERTAEFAYSDAMLLADANEMSIDLVKASVAVAFTAYQKKNVDAVLEKMGFDALDNSGAYDIVKNLTIDDNDHVAYTIARKTIEHDGQTYVAYCIPVKGTSGNAEWFSNFNLGEEVSVHKGFMTASNRVYDAMRKAFSGDGVDADHRIVWITGHSRGAACANIIAGWLAAEEFARRERTFAYTYACPSVSTKANETLTNIYNFNNIGDVVTMLPLTKSGWGYKRNGQTIILDLDHVDNFKQRFRTVAKEAYVGQLTNTNYEGLLGSWLPDRDDYFEFRNQLITQVVAYAFGGNTDCTLGEFLKHLCDMTSGDIAKKISACQSIPDLMDLSVSMGDIYARLIRNGMKFYEDTKAMSEEDFRGYVQNNAGAISELEEASGLVITSAAVFPKAVEVCEQLQEKALGIKKVVDLVTQLFIDSNGDPLPAFMQAHDHTCYITWINSMFYGYQGWMGNKVMTEAYIPANHSEVGKGCFSGCTGLEEVVVEDGVYYLGDSSFSNCTSLKKVEIPVDIGCSITSSHPFAGTCGVTEVFYTRGRTGVMTDRTETNSYSTDKYYQYTLEFASRGSLTKVSFDEGITHIGNYAFYPYYYNNP
ncbi:MAG: leucine-rich repeat protein, partial [Oscillospiraceae bacterium]|nr:leucine-rich repeat protein [Oscillospiraceae bacterium]